MAYSFTTQGSTPSAIFPQSSPAPMGGTPAGTALTLAADRNGLNSPGTFTGSGFNGSHIHIAPSAAPSTPVKSQTITAADGSSHTTTYHDPDPAMSYKGILINPGSDADIAAQVAKIDAGNSSPTIKSSPNDSGGTFTQNSPTNTSSTTNNPAPSSNNPVYSGYVSSLGNTAANGSSTTSGLIGKTADYGAGNIAIGDKAAAIAADYGKQIADVGRKGASFESGQLTTGTSPVAEGNAAVTAQTTAAQQQALAAGESAALQGTSQELTGQAQAANAANAAAGQANTAQGLTQSGLESAASLSKPTENYPFVFNPLTGTFTNAGGGTLSDADAAQAVIDGKLSYDQAASSIPGAAGESRLQQAILAKGGNPLSLKAQGAAAQSNITTAGTAPTNTFSQIYAQAKSQAAQYSQQQNAINQVGNQVTDLLTNNPEINQFALQYGNRAINSLQTQLSDPRFAAFNTAIQTLQNRIATALQAGEIPTAATNNAQAIANGNLSLGALAATLQQVDKEMSAFVGTQNALADYAQGQMSSGGVGSSPAPSGSSSSIGNWAWNPK